MMATPGRLSTKETDHGCQQSTITQCRTGPTGVDRGKLPGPKPPLRLGHVWSIRARLQLRRTRDLALFNLAIDSKLRGCDLVALRVDDVVPNGYAVDRATVRQRKTGRPVRFKLTEVTRQAVDDYLRESGLMSGQCLFPDRSATGHSPARQHNQSDGPLAIELRARCDTWAWRWTASCSSQRRSRSEIPGQSCHALPTPRRGEV